MYDEMTIDDAINVVRMIGDERCDDPDRDIRALARAARRLLHQIDELAFELNASEPADLASNAETRDSRTGIGSTTEETAVGVAISSPAAVCTPARRFTC